MDWATIADRAQIKKCNEARKYERCNCGSGRKENPCDKLEIIRQACVNLSIGESADMTIDEIKKWASYQICAKSRADRSCNHKACVIGEKIVDWLETTTILTMPTHKEADKEAA